MKACPHCAAQNADDRAFCASCGTSLRDLTQDGPIGSLPPGPISLGPLESAAETPPSPPPEKPAQQEDRPAAPPPQSRAVGGQQPQAGAANPAMSPPPPPPNYQAPRRPVEQSKLPPVMPPASLVPPPMLGQIPPPGPAFVTTSPQSQTAVWSLVLGIVSVVCCAVGLITGPLAIIFGLRAQKEVSANQGMAIAGLVLGAIGTVSSLVSIIGCMHGSYFHY